MPSIVSRALHASGISHLVASQRDVRLLLAQKCVRMFAYGATTFIFVLHLSLLGFDQQKIGLFFTLALLGDVFISLILTLFADDFGRKNVLVVSAALMIISGVVFASSENFWLLLLTSIVGVISPSGSEIGPFRAVEDSILAQLTPEQYRSDIFAWANLGGGIGIASGQAISGGALQLLRDRAKWEWTRSYKLTFAAYGGLGVVKLLLSASLSQACEVDKGEAAVSNVGNDTPTVAAAEDPSETQPLLDGQTIDQKKPERTRVRFFLPRFSAQSGRSLIKMCSLFALDSFASGMIGPAWISFFFVNKFHINSSVLGAILATCYFVSAASNLFSASIARRIGLVPAMVSAHLPSSVFLVLIPVPKQMALAALFLGLRHTTVQMDTGPRQALIAGAVLPCERTATMGVVNMVRIMSQSLGPSATGLLASKVNLELAFLVAGFLKIAYDLLMLVLFWGYKGREDEVDEDDDTRRES